MSVGLIEYCVYLKWYDITTPGKLPEIVVIPLVMRDVYLKCYRWVVQDG